MDKQYQKQCPIDGGTCGQGGTCFVCENEALGSQLTAANARILELLSQQQREAEQRKKQGLILDYAMRGLRHSAEQPNDGRMDAIRAMAGRIEELVAENQALREGLEPFAREEIGTMYKDPWHLQFSDPDGFVDFTDFTIGDLRRAAALLEKK